MSWCKKDRKFCTRGRAQAGSRNLVDSLGAYECYLALRIEDDSFRCLGGLNMYTCQCGFTCFFLLLRLTSYAHSPQSSDFGRRLIFITPSRQRGSHFHRPWATTTARRTSTNKINLSPLITTSLQNSFNTTNLATRWPPPTRLAGCSHYRPSSDYASIESCFSPSWHQKFLYTVGPRTVLLSCAHAR
jgi:hypothetical protein